MRERHVKRQQFTDRPAMVGDPRRHGWRHLPCRVARSGKSQKWVGCIIMMNDGWRDNMYARLPDNGCDGCSGPTGGQRNQRPGGIAMDRTTEMVSAFVCDLHY